MLRRLRDTPRRGLRFRHPKALRGQPSCMPEPLPASLTLNRCNYIFNRASELTRYPVDPDESVVVLQFRWASVRCRRRGLSHPRRGLARKLKHKVRPPVACQLFREAERCRPWKARRDLRSGRSECRAIVSLVRSWMGPGRHRRRFYRGGRRDAAWERFGNPGRRTRHGSPTSRRGEHVWIRNAPTRSLLFPGATRAVSRPTE